MIQLIARSEAFSLCDLEDDRRHSRSDFSLFSPRNLTFKHSLDAEIDIEDKESKRFKERSIARLRLSDQESMPKMLPRVH